MRVLIFGTGNYYKRYKKWFSKQEVVAILDNAVEKQNTILDGIKVYSPDKVVDLGYDYIFVLSFYYEEMKSQLVNLGVSKDKICHFFQLYKFIDDNRLMHSASYYGILPEEIEQQKKETILLLSADLDLQSGPAKVLVRMAQIIKQHGQKVVIGTMQDGTLRKTLVEENIPVIVDSDLQVANMKDIVWTHGFKKILCNTIGFYAFILDRDISTPVIWWLHDSEFFMHGIESDEIQNTNCENLEIKSVGNIPAKAIQKYWSNVKVSNLLYGVPNTSIELNDTCVKNEDSISFLTLGYIEKRKGQDILLEAIESLEDNIRNKAKFYFVGNDTSVMAKEIKEKAKDIPEIIMTGMVDEEEKRRLFANADVLICPSREDPMPAVVTEAMMNGVPCIMSDAVGQAEFIINRENGFKFKSQNVKELADNISWCMENRTQLHQIGKVSKSIYENKFSMEAYDKEIIETVING